MPDAIIFTKNRNSALMKHGPLSDTREIGKPKETKQCLKFLIVTEAVVQR